MHHAGSKPTGTPDEHVPDHAHAEHHGLVAVLDTAGEIYSTVLFSFVGPHRPEHWEQVLEKYEHDHPKPDSAA